MQRQISRRRGDPDSGYRRRSGPGAAVPQWPTSAPAWLIALTAAVAPLLSELFTTVRQAGSDYWQLAVCRPPKRGGDPPQRPSDEVRPDPDLPSISPMSAGHRKPTIEPSGRKDPAHRPSGASV